MQRILTLALAAALVVTACSDDELSVSEYAASLEEMVGTMNVQLDGIDAELETLGGIEGVRRYAERRVEIRNEFVGGIESLEAPERLVDFHDQALVVIRRLTEAETLLAETALSAESIDDVAGLWDSEAGLAAREVDQEALEICRAAEDELNTADDALAADVPWIPPEMKEVVRVAFYCDRSDRP